MLKKIFLILIFSVSIINGQNTIKGIMNPPLKTNWIILQKIQGAKPKFITSTTIKIDTITIDGVKQSIGRFKFNLPKKSKSAMYRVIYKNRQSGFVDFIYNNNDVEMVFNPYYPDQSLVFTKSKENKIYNNYNKALELTQRKVDSIQLSFIEKKDNKTKQAYKNAVKKVDEIQKIYEKKSKGMLANFFIKSLKSSNSTEPKQTTDEYLNYVIKTFFDNTDFKSKELYNSSILINKIVDYIFYLNNSDNQQLQQKLFKESITKVLSIIKQETELKKEVLEFLIENFTEKRNSEIVDWLFKDYYDLLPKKLIDSNFKAKKLKALSVSVGRKAPDFSWKEANKKYKLSTLNDGEKYLLIFWSTRCPHCTKEIPEVYKFMKNYKNVSVVAVAIENNNLDFNSWAKNKLYNWHNVLATHPKNRFDNKIVRKYLISETPTYFVLNKNKKIIAIPNLANDVHDYFKSLNKK